MVGILYPGVHCLKPHAMIDGGPVSSCGSGEMNSGRVNFFLQHIRKAPKRPLTFETIDAFMCWVSRFDEEGNLVIIEHEAVLFDCGIHEQGKHLTAIPEVGPFDRDFSIHGSILRELLKISALQRDPDATKHIPSYPPVNEALIKLLGQRFDPQMGLFY